MPLFERISTFFLALLLACGCGWLPALPAAAAESAAQGVLEVGAQKTALKYAAAVMHDNAEGLLPGAGQELRILLTDVEVAPAGLHGIAFVPVTQEARAGKVHGLLLTLNPDDPYAMQVTVLAPSRPGAALDSLSLTSQPAPLIADYKMAGNAVSGSFKLASGTLRSDEIRFTAVVQPEPAITADLKGRAALASPHLKALRARAQAMVKGDNAAVARLSTPSENRELDAALAQLGAQAMPMMRDAGKDMLLSLGGVERVVVRGDHAVVIFQNKEAWQDMALVDGQWKTGK